MKSWASGSRIINSPVKLTINQKETSRTIVHEWNMQGGVV